jgi:hypothetical protein
MTDISNKSDYYERLGVPKTATQKEIRHAFLEGAKRWHPDKNSASDAEENFKLISEAYSTLNDEKRRSAYDRTTVTATGSEGATSTTSVSTNHKNETRTRHHWSEADESFINSFLGVGYDGNDSVTGWAASYGGEKGEHKTKFNLKSPVSTEIIGTYGRLQIHEPELELMAGLVEAQRTVGPFVAECGAYRIVKAEDVGDVPGAVKIEVKLRRFVSQGGEGRISVAKKEGFGYNSATRDDWVSADEVADPMRVIGIVHPIGYKDYLGKLGEMASTIASGRVIDGRKIIELDTAGMICFTKTEGRMVIEAKSLRDQVDEALNKWRIQAPEGSLFSNTERASGSVGREANNRQRR